MNRVYNFCAGPSTIAEAVLKRAQSELLDWRGHGTSVMEISHRGDIFIDDVLRPAEANLRKLLNISDDYEVLFISAGTSHQFSMVPLNLLERKKNQIADYFYTGIWSGKAIKEAQRYGEINIALNCEDSQFSHIPCSTTWQLHPDASYVHYTPNETIGGLEFHEIPNVGNGDDNIPLVADMSSTILSRPIDVNRFGLIYAGAQKNIGPAGLTIVIVRKNLLGYAKSTTPNFYNYVTYAKQQSVANTPATFAIYLSGLVFEWLLDQGGLENIGKINSRKAQKLYAQIDNSGFYRNPININYRSWMNVIFYLPTPELDTLFAKEAHQAGLVNLKGHKAIGGIRASIYNAMPEAGVEALIGFMQDFEKQYG